MNWYGNSNIKYASLSDDRFVEVLGQTYPQLLEAWTTYEIALKSNRINEIIDEYRKFAKKINYTWNGKKYEFELQIANSELGPVESNKDAFARGKDIIWANYPRFASRDKDLVFAHELAHILQATFGRSGIMAREITKGGKITSKLVDYMYRFYEIHARWMESIKERLDFINFASDKVKNSELIKKEFALNNKKEFNNIKKQIIAYMFYDKVINPFKDTYSLSIPRNLRKNFENSDGIEMLRHLIQSEMRTALLTYANNEIFNKRTNPVKSELLDKSYGNETEADAQVIKPKDKNIENYLNKLKLKYVAISETYMIKKYNELVMELVENDEAEKKSILQSRKREAEKAEINNEILREISKFTSLTNRQEDTSDCKSQLGKKFTEAIIYHMGQYRSGVYKFPYLSSDKFPPTAIGGTADGQYDRIAHKELIDFAKKMNYDESTASWLYSKMKEDSNAIMQKIVSHVLHGDPVWVKNAPYYHNPELLKNFSQNEDVKLFMHKVSEYVYNLSAEAFNLRIKNGKNINHQESCLLFYLLSKNKSFYSLEKENAISFILENAPWDSFDYSLIKDTLIARWNRVTLYNLYNMAEKAMYLKPEGTGSIETEIKNWAKSWLESKGEKIVQKANQATEPEKDKVSPLKRIWDVFRGK